MKASGAEKGKRTADRRGCRSGNYGRTLITRIGKLELRVPQHCAQRFSTELFPAIFSRGVHRRCRLPEWPQRGVALARLRKGTSVLKIKGSTGQTGSRDVLPCRGRNEPADDPKGWQNGVLIGLITWREKVDWLYLCL